MVGSEKVEMCRLQFVPCISKDLLFVFCFFGTADLSPLIEIRLTAHQADARVKYLRERFTEVETRSRNCNESTREASILATASAK